MFVSVLILNYLCRWQVQVSVYCARRIPAYLKCSQCSILLHLIDFCFLPYICLWQILQIQTSLCLTWICLDISPAFCEEQRQLSSGSSLPRKVNRGHIAGVGRFRHHFNSSLPKLLCCLEATNIWLALFTRCAIWQDGFNDLRIV